MSGYIVQKFWHLRNYKYAFYRFAVELYSQQVFQKKRHLMMLDAGCGSRICSLSYVPKKVYVIGIDVSRENVINSHRKAKERNYNNFNFICASINSIPIKQETFDLIVCIDVLEHLSNKYEAITEMYRVCKKQASLICSTSNILNPFMLFDSIAPKIIVKVLENKFAPGHYERHTRYQPAKLIQDFKRIGFKNINLRLFGFPFFQPWIYQFSNKKIPWYAYFWIAFDKLTEHKPLNFLKEVIVIHANK